MRTAIAFLILASTAAAGYPVAALSYKPTAFSGYFSTQSLSESAGPYIHHEGTDLVLFEVADDGTAGNLRTLAKGKDGEWLAVHDFCRSLDGKAIYYSHVRTGGKADIWRIVVATGEKTRLTSDGSWNMSPCEYPGGIIFTSNRRGVKSPKETYPAQQLFRMKHDGSCVEQIGPGIDLGGAAHPVILKSGRILFSSSQQQGLRGGGGENWALWSINPDGTSWGPEFSVCGFWRTSGQTGPARGIDTLHFHCETSDGHKVTEWYYDTRAYGTLMAWPEHKASPFAGPTQFGHPLWTNNPIVKFTAITPVSGPQDKQFPFQPKGLTALTPWVDATDAEARDAAGKPVGMVAHPSAIPGNGILLTHTGTDGDAKMRLRIAMIPDVTKPTAGPADLKTLDIDPTRHVWMAQAIVPFQSIYGIANPPVPTAPIADSIPAGSPFGLIGSSSMNWREITEQGDGQNPDRLPKFLATDDSKIEYLRIKWFNPTTVKQTHGETFNELGGTSGEVIPNYEGFRSQVNEREGLFVDDDGNELLIPLRKYRKADGTVHYGPNPPADAKPILDPGGKPDTSFAAIVPADVSWTFALLDKDKRTINGATAQTWHQVRPREKRVDCNGCHAHHQPTPFLWKDTFAAKTEYPVKRLWKPKTVEYHKDIKPLGLALGNEPWKTGGKAYQSELSTVDVGTLTAAEKETFYAWLDTGLLTDNGGGALKDETPPTLTAAIYSDKIVVGSFDFGLDKSSLSIKADVAIAGRAAGTELVDLFTHDSVNWTWALAAPVPTAGSLFATTKDSAGLVSSRQFSLGGGGDSPPPPPSTDEEIERLKARIAELEAANTAQAAEIAKLRSALESILDTAGKALAP